MNIQNNKQIINESIGQSIDYKLVADMYIRFQKETYECLDPDDTGYIEEDIQNYDPKVIEQAMEESDTDNLYDLSWYINDLPEDIGDACRELLYYYVIGYAQREYHYIIKSFTDNDNIYRAISSDFEYEPFIKQLMKNGTGNCWAKTYRYAKQYIGNRRKYTYIIKGIVTDDNIDWERTIALNMQDETEGEIRLKPNIDIMVTQVLLDNTKIDTNLELNTGSKYSYDHYQIYESKVQDKTENQIQIDKQWYHQRVIDSYFGDGSFEQLNIGDDIDLGKKEQPTQQNKYKLNNNFWAWFGNSKVVDKDGNPLVCYHGSEFDIEKFDKAFSGATTGNNYAEVFYFTSNKESAIDYSVEATVRAHEADYYDDDKLQNEKTYDEYAEEIRDRVREEPHINPCFLKMENPYIYDNHGERFNYSKFYTIQMILQGRRDIDNNLFDESIWDELINVFGYYDEDGEFHEDDRQYDGLIIKNIMDDIGDFKGIIDEYIVWNANQIKSVNNKGSWSIASDNINESIEYIEPKLNDNFWKYRNEFINNDNQKSILEANFNYGILYHGTNASFDVFDKKYINGGYLGQGFYFTMSKNMAKSYGKNIIEAKLNYNNSFMFDWDVLDDNSLNKILNTSNADDNNKNRIFNQYKDAVERYTIYEANTKFFDVMDFYKGDTTKILKELGYDSIDNIERNSEFVVFEPDQIKIIKRLNESIEYAESYYDDLYMVIYKNPNRDDLYDDTYQQFRIVEDTKGNWYFGNAHDYIHQELLNTLNKKRRIKFYNWEDYNTGYNVMLYDNKTNTFIYRVDIFENDKDKELRVKNECLESFKDILKNKVNETFAGYKVCISNDEEPWLDYSTAYFGNDNKEQLNESLKRLDDNMFFTSSSYDILNLIQNKPKEYRIVYDKNIDLYMICDANESIHYEMLKKAYNSGLYYNMDEFIDDLGSFQMYIEVGIDGGWNPNNENEEIDSYLYYMIFDPTNEWKVGDDGYDTIYKLPFGNILTRKCDITEIPLYNILPLGEQLNESVKPKLNDNFWKWFGNSKVVDKKGKPLVVYHGSQAKDIQVFDPTRGFNIPAIYFSNKLSVASHWSGDWLAKRNIKIEETDDVKKLLKILNNFEKTKIVNYDGFYRLKTEGYGIETSTPLGEKIDDRYYQMDDGRKTDLVKMLQRAIRDYAYKSENSGNYACYLSIQNPLEVYACKKPYWKIDFLGKKVNTETIADYAKNKGFDGVIIYDVYETDYENQLCNDYIVFSPNQIKSIDNNGNWSTESGNIYESLENEKAQLNESVEYKNTLSYMNKCFDDYLTRYDIYWILNNVENKGSIWYPLINPQSYKKALSEFMEYGEFMRFPTRVIEDWIHIILKNSAIFENCRALYGWDDDYNGWEKVYDYYYGDNDLTASEFRDKLYNDKKIPVDDDSMALQYVLNEHGVYDKISLPDDTSAFSDQQCYYDICEEFNNIETPEEAIVLINRALDVWHQRGDLSSMFIEGGRETLRKISNESKSIKGKILNESLDFYTSVLDAYGDQLQCKMIASENGKEVGYIDFSVYNDEPYVQMIKVKKPYRRKGYATQMIKNLQKEYPNSEIDFGMTTEDGTKLLNNIPFDIKVNPEYDKKKKQADRLKKWLDTFKKFTDKVYQQIDNNEPIDEDIRLYIVNNTYKWQEIENKYEQLIDWLNENKREKRFVKIEDKDNLYEWWSGGVNWQNDREGLGGVGATMDCHLFFFMFPNQFLNLCPKFNYGDEKFFNQYVDSRKPIGIPFLWCEVDEKNKTLKVLDHEGRHRVQAIRDYALSKGKLQPDIPVAIIYNKDKYSLPHDLTELRKNWKIVSQKGDMTYNVGQFSVQNNLDNARIGLDNLYESLLNEMAYPQSFDLQYFSRIKTFRERLEYCEQRLQKIGEGTSRVVFKVDDEKVIKIAKNNKGVDQNKNEYMCSNRDNTIFTKVFESHPSYKWIEMELANPCSLTQFENLLGTSVDYLKYLLYYLLSNYSDVPEWIESYVEWGEQLLKKNDYFNISPTLNGLYNYITTYQPSRFEITDWLSPNQWGIVQRNGQDTLVIVDLGLTEEIWHKHYEPHQIRKWSIYRR